MILNIDLQRISKKGLTINQYLLLLKIYYLTKNVVLDFNETKQDYVFLRDSGFLNGDGLDFSLTDKAVYLIEGKVKRNYIALAEQIREIFPKGAKAGIYPWKSNIQDIASKLQKLDKSNTLFLYDDAKILEVVTKYVNSFNLHNMDSGMQISKYFIEKDGSSSLLDLLALEETEVKTRNIRKL